MAFNYLPFYTSPPATLSRPIGEALEQLPSGLGVWSWKGSSHLRDRSLLCKAALLCGGCSSQRPPAQLLVLCAAYF